MPKMSHHRETFSQKLIHTTHIYVYMWKSLFVSLFIRFTVFQFVWKWFCTHSQQDWETAIAIKRYICFQFILCVFHSFSLPFILYTVHISFVWLLYVICECTKMFQFFVRTKCVMFVEFSKDCTIQLHRCVANSRQKWINTTWIEDENTEQSVESNEIIMMMATSAAAVAAAVTETRAENDGDDGVKVTC